MFKLAKIQEQIKLDKIIAEKLHADYIKAPPTDIKTKMHCSISSDVIRQRKDDENKLSRFAIAINVTCEGYSDQDNNRVDFLSIKLRLAGHFVVEGGKTVKISDVVKESSLFSNRITPRAHILVSDAISRMGFSGIGLTVGMFHVKNTATVKKKDAAKKKKRGKAKTKKK